MKQASPPSAFVEVRGPSGRLYGRLDPQRMVIEFKHPGKPAETIDLTKYRKATGHE
jgi:hypothetical protein